MNKCRSSESSLEKTLQKFCYVLLSSKSLNFFVPAQHAFTPFPFTGGFDTFKKNTGDETKIIHEIFTAKTLFSESFLWNH